MIRVPNWYLVGVCGAVRKSGRCPELCLKHGGCFMPQFREPLNQAECERRCHRAHRIMEELNELRRTEVNHVPSVQSQRNANQGNRRVD